MSHNFRHKRPRSVEQPYNPLFQIQPHPMLFCSSTTFLFLPTLSHGLLSSLSTPTPSTPFTTSLPCSAITITLSPTTTPSPPSSPLVPPLLSSPFPSNLRSSTTPSPPPPSSPSTPSLPLHARKLFDEIPQPDNVCFSALVVALAQNSCSVDALSVFFDMGCCGFASIVHSIFGGLRATAQLVALEQCRMMHAHAIIITGLDSNVVVASALVDGYGKVGVVNNARRVFEDGFSYMNIVRWNAMMASYAQQGDYHSTFELFESLERCGLVPDEYTFLAILTALCNAGMFLEIDRWFTQMRVDYGLEPSLEHYTCLVSVMVRAGELERAERVVLTMPFEPNVAVWQALLSACAYHGKVDKAWCMAKRVLELEPYDNCAHVIVANVLSSAGKWDDVAKLRKIMKDRRVVKKGERSWIEVQGEVHVFVTGDWKHKRSKEIYQKLVELMGYVPVWDEVLHNVGEKKRKEALWCHSEKLAIAFGVLCGSAPPGKPLRIIKNFEDL